MGVVVLDATAEYLHRAIEFAPLDAGPLAWNLAGWWVPGVAGDWWLCAGCGGRIVARGCYLPKGSSPVWSDRPPVIRGVCVCCGS